MAWHDVARRTAEKLHLQQTRTRACAQARPIRKRITRFRMICHDGQKCGYAVRQLTRGKGYSSSVAMVTFYTQYQM